MLNRYLWKFLGWKIPGGKGKIPYWEFTGGGKTVRGIFRGGIFSVGEILEAKKVGGDYGGFSWRESTGGEITGHC